MTLYRFYTMEGQAIERPDGALMLRMVPREHAEFATDEEAFAYVRGKYGPMTMIRKLVPGEGSLEGKRVFEITRLEEGGFKKLGHVEVGEDEEDEEETARKMAELMFGTEVTLMEVKR